MMDGTATVVESTDCSGMENEESGSYSGSEAGKVPGIEMAEALERELLTRQAVPRFCLLLQILLQLMSRKARKSR